MANPIEQTAVSVKAFALAALLWLPAMFFVWFYLAAVWVAPTTVVLASLLPALELAQSVTQTGYLLSITTPIAATGYQGGAFYDVTVNPMIYAYGLPLYAGLTIATPLSALGRTWRLALGALVLALVQGWGTFWDYVRTLRFTLGDAGADLVAQAGLPTEAIALAYQLGYLILPAVVPVMLWLATNRRYIESLVQRAR